MLRHSTHGFPKRKGRPSQPKQTTKQQKKQKQKRPNIASKQTQARALQTKAHRDGQEKSSGEEEEERNLQEEGSKYRTVRYGKRARREGV